jgi:hypothetical protein
MLNRAAGGAADIGIGRNLAVRREPLVLPFHSNGLLM